MDEPRYITSGSEMARPTLRGAVRHAALSALGRWHAWLNAAAPSPAPAVQILLLHHVFPDEAAAFRALLARLQREFQFVSYSEAVRRALSGGTDRPCLAFTFDDGLKCCWQAADVLEEFGARACFFVCPAMVGETDFAVLTQFCRVRLRHAAVEFLNWDDLERLRDRGHEVGGHTMRHADLAQVPLADAVDDVASSQRTIQKRLGVAEHFAWPYGTFANFRPELVGAVYAAGYASCASGVRGCHAVAPARTTAAGQCQPAPAPWELCVRRESIVAAWPQSHVYYFLNRSARRPLGLDKTWPASWSGSIHSSIRESLCTLPSTRCPATRAAA